MRQRNRLCVALLIIVAAVVPGLNGSCTDASQASSSTEVNGVIVLLQTDLADSGFPQVVLGQLTKGGEPVAGSQFVVREGLAGSGLTSRPYAASMELPLKAGDTGYYNVYYVLLDYDGIDADGAQIHYILHSGSGSNAKPTEILSYNITATDFATSPFLELTDIDEVLDELSEMSELTGLFQLLFLPVDPPGEGHVGFF